MKGAEAAVRVELQLLVHRRPADVHLLPSEPELGCKSGLRGIRAGCIKRRQG